MALTPQEKSPYYMIASLYWDNMQALQEALHWKSWKPNFIVAASR
jgi:hypothetical protein